MKRYRCAHAYEMALVGAILAWGAVDEGQAQQLQSTGQTFGTPSRQIELNLSNKLTYDSNVARSSDTGATARGIRKQDFYYSPALEANIALPTPAAVLTLTGSVGYEFYSRNKRLDRERLNLLAGAASKLSFCDAGLLAGYTRGQSDLNDLSIVPGDVEASRVNVQETVRLGGNISCGTGSIRPNAFIEYRTSDNSAPVRQISDVDMLTYGGGLSYSSPAFGILTAFVGRTELDFQNRANLVGAVNSVRVSMAGLKLDRRLGARLQVNGQIYYADVDGLAGSDDRYDGLNWDVSATLRAGERLQMTMGVSRQIDASGALNVNAAQITLYNAKLAFALSPLMQLTLGGSMRKRDFDVDPTLSPVALLTNDKISQIEGGLSYDLGRRIQLGLKASYQDRSADTALYNYDAFLTSFDVKLKL